MSSTIDIVAVKHKIKMGRWEVVFHRGNILLRDTRSGEAVKIGELPGGSEPKQRETVTTEPWQNCSNCGDKEYKTKCDKCISSINNGKISIPSEWKPRFVECREQVWMVTEHEAPFGYKIIAEKCGCSVADLLCVNKTNERTALRPGQKLKLPKEEV